MLIEEAPNQQLAVLVRQAGWVLPDGSAGLKELARAVQRVADERGIPKQYTHTYARRWLEGRVPRDTTTRRFIAEALSSRLARTVGIDEIGLAPEERPGRVAAAGAQPSGLIVPGSPGFSTVLSADIREDPSARALRANPAVSNDAALSWLVRRSSGSVGADPIGGRVGYGQVEQIHSMIDLYGEMDNQHGGGHGRLSLAHYLQHEAMPLLRGSQSGAIRSALSATLAQGMLTLAWMSYDAGFHGLAQQYFIDALNIASESGDASLGGSILDAMSHQATFLGNYREAANLAAAARMGTASLVAPTLEAHFYAMEARALAGAGEAQACDQALRLAEKAFERGDPADAPEWIQYFDLRELNAELAHCHRDLGRPSRAVEHAAAATVVAADALTRSDFFATMVQAHAYLDQGEVEEGCSVALKALDLGEQLTSARCVTYADEFRGRLGRFRNAAVVGAFEIEAAKRTLWTPAA